MTLSLSQVCNSDLDTKVVGFAFNPSQWGKTLLLLLLLQLLLLLLFTFVTIQDHMTM